MDTAEGEKIIASQKRPTLVKRGLLMSMINAATHTGLGTQQRENG
jgi:hypothetical protein